MNQILLKNGKKIFSQRRRVAEKSLNMFWVKTKT